jgi:diguanylate cyclase (GGDEF)-like protein
VLTLVRFLGFLAPLAVAAALVVWFAVASMASPEERLMLSGAAGIAALAGMTTMALLAWSYIGWRLARIAQALERTLESETPVLLRVSGIPAERRLARAFNEAADTFLLTEQRATHDRLTGVANRETLLSTLHAEIERATRHYTPLSVAFIDIDRFKPINDMHGHNSGDVVLRQVARLVSRSVRASDAFGRYGGEEFMLILPETTPEDAVNLAEELRNLVMAEPMQIAGGQTINVTISVGIAGGVGSQLQLDMLVDRADAAMYAAKSLGRNRTYLFREVDEEAPVRRAPISASHRAQATAIGRWASDTATQALASVLAPQPHHRGRPSDMIASLATGIALEMNLAPAEIERIRVASLLHDLGKIAIPEEILDKPEELTDGEWQTIGQHPRIGQVILEQASSLREAIPVVLHHHERYNGGGYPHGLRGNEIPIGARIVAVADAYHAMIHDRPYSTALGHEAALRELRENAGTQFDPGVVDVFCRIYADAVPPDGLEEIYRLHERTVDGLTHVDANGNGHNHVHRPPEPEVERTARRTRTPRATAARRRKAADQ